MSEEYSVIALYGISTTEGLLKHFHDAVLHWFDELECPPDYMAVSGAGHSDKAVLFQSVEAKLQKTGYDGIESISLISTLPNYVTPVNDYKLSTYCSIKRDILFLSSMSSLASLDKKHMFSVVSKLLRQLNPAYGIGYTRDHSFGPAMYAIGIVQGLGTSGDEDMEGLNISFWNNGKRARVWERGLVRDVYEWNFLNQQQLAMAIHGIALKSWIQSDSRRGTLTAMSGGIVLWEIDRADIPAARRALWDAGLIFDWTTHIEGAQAHPNAMASRAWQASR